MTKNDGKVIVRDRWGGILFLQFSIQQPVFIWRFLSQSIFPYPCNITVTLKFPSTGTPIDNERTQRGGTLKGPVHRSFPTFISKCSVRKVNGSRWNRSQVTRRFTCETPQNTTDMANARLKTPRVNRVIAVRGILHIGSECTLPSLYPTLDNRGSGVITSKHSWRQT